MILIEKNALIIKIKCPDNNALATLAELHRGLAFIIQRLQSDEESHPEEPIAFYQLSLLFMNTLLNQDQMSAIGGSLSKETINKVNEWGIRHFESEG